MKAILGLLAFFAHLVNAELRLVELENPQVSMLSEILGELRQEGSLPEFLTLSFEYKKDFLTNLWAVQFKASSVLQNPDVLEHLQAKGLYANLFPAKTTLGTVYGELLLKTGAIVDIAELQERQKLIKFWAENHALRTQIRKVLTPLKAAEDSWFHILNPEKSLKTLPLQPIATQPLPFFSFFLKNYYYMLGAYHFWLGAKASLSGFFKIQTYGWIPLVKGTLWRVCAGFAAYMNVIFGGISIYKQVQKHRQLDAENQILTRHLKNLESLLIALPQLGISIPKELQELQSAIANIYHTGDSHFFQANLLRALTAIEQAIALKEALQTALFELAKLDFYTSVAETVAGSKLDITYAKFVESQQPVLKAKGLWNPLLSKKTAIKNSLDLEAQQRLVVLTGPNASGKSTLMRAFGINILLLAQTLGIATAESLELTPFEAFHGFLETKDVLGVSSSYETEVNRVVEALKFKGRSFWLADELFSSTNAKDALAGSKEILLRLDKLSQSVGLVSTHLYDLSLVSHNNWHMEAYCLHEGPSSERNALNILHQELEL